MIWKHIGFLAVVFLSTIVQCVTGFAGTVLAMPFSVMLEGIDTARPILNVNGLAASVIVAIKYRKEIHKKELLTILGVTLPGIFLGTYLKTILSEYGSVLLKTLGALVILFAVINFSAFMLKKNFAGRFKIVGYLFLISGGIVHGMFACGGPLIVTYAEEKIKDINAFRATLSSVWVILNTLVLVTDISSGFFTGQVLLLTGLCLAEFFGTVAIGNKLVAKLSRRDFLLLTYALMVISGISLLLK